MLCKTLLRTLILFFLVSLAFSAMPGMAKEVPGAKFFPKQSQVMGSEGNSSNPAANSPAEYSPITGLESNGQASSPSFKKPQDLQGQSQTFTPPGLGGGGVKMGPPGASGKIGPPGGAKMGPGAGPGGAGFGPPAGMKDSAAQADKFGPPKGIPGPPKAVKMLRGNFFGYNSQLYPSLMGYPEDQPLQKNKILAMAFKRMTEGYKLLNDTTFTIGRYAQRGNYQAIQKELMNLYEGYNQFTSGYAAFILINRGKPLNQVGIQWLRSQMNLSDMGLKPKRVPVFLGMTGQQLFYCSLMILFIILLLGMYFYRMRRASALLKVLQKGGGGSAAEAPAPSQPTAPAPSTQPPSPQATSEVTVPPTMGKLPKGEKWTGDLEVIGLFQETSLAKTFRLSLPETRTIPFDYEPGQFGMLSMDVNGKKVKRSYTIASSPTERDYIEFTIKREDMGVGSRFLHDVIKKGDFINIKAPLGKFYFNGSESDSIVLIGGGVGITPMMSATRYLTDRCWPGDIHLMLGFQEEEQIIFHDEIKQLQKRYDNLHVYISLSKADETWEGGHGHLTAEVFAQQIPDIQSQRCHICGPPVMMDAVKEGLIGIGVPKESIFTENFGTEKRKCDKCSPKCSPAKIADTAPMVKFTQADKEVKQPPNLTILELAEEVDVDIDFSCRVGVCGTCKCKLLQGDVDQETDEGLQDDEKAQGYILTCVSKAKTNIQVEA